PQPPADGNITVCNTGSLAVTQALSTVNAADTVRGLVRLTSTNSSVTQTAAGIITAAGLGVGASTGILLDAATNAVTGPGNLTAGNFAATTASGNLRLRDNAISLTLGTTITADGVCFPAAVT